LGLLFLTSQHTQKKAKQMIGWDLFSGIGGIKCGMALAGIKQVLGVELDPRDRKLSEAFIEIHLMNGWKGTRLETVQEFADCGCPVLPRNADIALISPVCADYSVATNGTHRRNEKQAMIRASMDAIEIGMPRCFTLEQVPMYRKSPEFAYMRDQAVAIGYTVNSTVLNIGAAFGQFRQRLIVTAALNANWESPIQPEIHSWYDAIKEFIPALDPIAPTPRQQQAVIDWQARNPDKLEMPLYVERVTCDKKPRARGQMELIPTLMKSKFRDGSNNGRSKVSCLYLPSTGDWLNLNLEAYARLSGFPDTFRYLNTPIVGAGFGYSVPPLFYASLLRTMPI